MHLAKLKEEIKIHSNTTIAEHSLKFFKTGKGEYGEGDKFLGIRVPVLRNLTKKYKDLTLEEVQELLKSNFHEERLLALLLMVLKYNNENEIGKKSIYSMYLKNTKHINNWDLVDCSAYKIVGNYLMDRDKKILYDFAESKSLWERRISIISTLEFIKESQFEDTLKISKKLINDPEDLIHKAVGWMLREVGKRDKSIEKAFLNKYYKIMPRTMLRYSIERFPKEERAQYLYGLI